MKNIIGQWANSGGGTLRLELSKYALVGGTSENAPRFYQIPLDVNGAIPAGYEIWANDEIMPDGTSYRRTVFDSSGYILFPPQQIWISGTEPISLTPATGGPILPPPQISVSISPSSAALGSGDSQQFTASVQNSVSQSVVWSTSLGTITTTGLYTAPSVSSTTTALVTATSGADPAASASVSVTISPVSVSIMPGSATLLSGQTQQFTATVTGSSNHNVTWSCSSGAINAAGLYTAPSPASAITVTITATSQADPTVHASVFVSVQPVPVISVTISPTAVTLTANQSQQFSATVSNAANQSVTWTTTLGTINALGVQGLYQSPSTIATATTATVTATSVADPTKSASATVSLKPAAGTQIDLLTWMYMDTRATQHLAGDPSAPYSVQMLDTDPGYPSNYPKNKLWQLKNKLGNPWDIHTYDSNFITHWITEDGDAVDQPACQAANGTSCWLYAKAYKRYLTPVNLMPRMFTPGSTVTLNNPGPNNVNRTTNCESTFTVVTIGDVQGVTTGPFLISWGGSIDHGTGTLASGPNYDSTNGVNTILNQYYYSGTIANNDFKDREEYYFVLGFGEVAWYHYHRADASSPWVFQQKTVNSVYSSGGAPTPNFPCGPGKSWFV